MKILSIGIDGNEVHTANLRINHVVNSIFARTPNTHNLNTGESFNFWIDFRHSDYFVKRSRLNRKGNNSCYYGQSSFSQWMKVLFTPRKIPGIIEISILSPPRPKRQS